MTTKSDTMRSTPLTHGGGIGVLVLEAADWLLSKIPARAFASAKPIAEPASKSKTDRRREELRHTIWTMGYSGFSRDAAKRLAELQRVDAGK